MTLAVRVIPTLLVRGANLVKGVRFNSWRVVGHAMQAARIHAGRQVDELILLDIAATPEGRGPDLELVGKLADECFMPLTVGGGVRSVEDVRRLLRAGADKVAIGTHGIGNMGLIGEAAGMFGNQAIVVSIDVDSTNEVCSRNATLRHGIDAERWAIECEKRGAGEILLTSIDREGTMSGYDLDLIRAVAEAVDIPVIAHGGAGTYQHMLEAVQAGASAVAAGAMFQFTDQTPIGAAEYLAAHGVETRRPNERPDRNGTVARA